MSFPALRKRKGSMPVVAAGGLATILQGVFGVATPNAQLSSPAAVQQTPGRISSFYTLHEGDLFTPGTGNWVLDPSLEVPLQTAWGHGFLRRPNVFSPIQPPQVYSWPTVVSVGVGGPIAGQIITQPLSLPETETGS